MATGARPMSSPAAPPGWPTTAGLGHGGTAAARTDWNVEVALAETVEQQQQHDRLANLFSIVVAADALENAFATDSIPDTTVHAHRYETEAKKLIGHFQTAYQPLKAQDPSFNLPAFMAQFQMTCPAGCTRLLKGVTAIEQLRSENAPKAAADSFRMTAHATQSFITLLDAISLNRRAADELQPFVSDLVAAVTAARNLLPARYDRERLARWLTLMNGMKAREELSDDQLRQMKFEIETAYGDFKDSIGHQG